MNYIAVKPVTLYEVPTYGTPYGWELHAECPSDHVTCMVKVTGMELVQCGSSVALRNLRVESEQRLLEGMAAIGCGHVAKAPRGWWEDGVA